MTEKYSRELKFMIFLLLVLIVILVIIVLVVLQIKKDNIECLGDPLIYGAKQLSKSNNAGISCDCYLLKPNSQSIHFNEENKWVR